MPSYVSIHVSIASPSNLMYTLAGYKPGASVIPTDATAIAPRRQDPISTQKWILIGVLKAGC
jgi:hypothetical protein